MPSPFMLNDQNACCLFTSPSPGRRESAGEEGLLSSICKSSLPDLLILCLTEVSVF